ncbi:protein kinase domain-containing protein [Bythopirellula goksoeyrii]|uniref:Serine/threonine-protein kinase PknB n=1 Tax=Bythopirellula goksoeyrii TaxID=1400387 RepID=A0A5B9Q8A5_9BACT|nr:protein kinase [Bythopirellula goksoeyrii]QEG33126.1 Serine/threonine-protein kinase PknB [Bythopirellula goksoeyrii]
MKVLIAEDNPLWRGMLTQNVQSWGHDPVIAEDGTQAWEILQKEDAPRLVILDWQMPGMDGIEVCRLVKRNPNHPFTYVVMLTSRDAQEDMVAGLDAGADDYLTKPIDPAVLKSRMAAAERIVKLVPPKEWTVPQVEGYDVKQMLGKGVFATVWEAERQQSSETVALKIIRVDLATDDVFGRFAREIELMEKLDHPNIAKIYDSHIDKTLGYYAMELVQGGTLEKYVQEKKPKGAVLIYMIAKVCDALDHAHKQGVIHRDLKPSNIMMTLEDEPKLVDFGLARSMFMANAEDSAVQSMDGSVIGTPMFMSPEQARGENDKLDGRADIYAVGIILYVMLLRKHPHKINHQDRWETIHQIASGQVRRPSEVRPNFDKRLEDIIMKALANQPAFRYQTAGEFAKALRHFLKQLVKDKKS